jgi:hypothetical protein
MDIEGAMVCFERRVQAFSPKTRMVYLSHLLNGSLERRFSRRVIAGHCAVFRAASGCLHKGEQSKRGEKHEHPTCVHGLFPFLNYSMGE